MIEPALVDASSSDEEIYMITDPVPVAHDYMTEDVTDIWNEPPFDDDQTRRQNNPHYPPTPVGWPYSVEEWEVLYDQRRRPTPPSAQEDVRCVVEVMVGNGLRPNHPAFRTRRLIGLLDSGSSVSITCRGVVPIDCPLEGYKPKKHTTLGGTFVTHSTTMMPLVLPQFSEHRVINAKLLVDETIGVGADARVANSAAYFQFGAVERLPDKELLLIRQT
jgi:hypothetical protein